MRDWVKEIKQKNNDEAIRLFAQACADRAYRVDWSSLQSQEDFRQHFVEFEWEVLDDGTPSSNHDALLLVVDLEYYYWEKDELDPQNATQLAFSALNDWYGHHWKEIFQATIDIILRDESIPKKDKRWMRVADV